MWCQHYVDLLQAFEFYHTSLPAACHTEAVSHSSQTTKQIQNIYCMWILLCTSKIHKMTVSSNRLLLVLSRLCQAHINSIAAKYGTAQPLVNVSCTRIKWHVWDTFACNVLWLYVGLFADDCVIDCICLFFLLAFMLSFDVIKNNNNNNNISSDLKSKCE